MPPDGVAHKKSVVVRNFRIPIWIQIVLIHQDRGEGDRQYSHLAKNQRLEFFKITDAQKARGNLVTCPTTDTLQRKHRMTHVAMYACSANDWQESQDAHSQSYREKHFHQWVFTDNWGYCMAHAGWPFFSFLKMDSQILCLACSDDGTFWESRMEVQALEQKLTRLLHHKALAGHPCFYENILMSLLDRAARQRFFRSLPHQPIDPDLALWDEWKRQPIFFKELIGEKADPVAQECLSQAFFQWMDSELLDFLKNDPRPYRPTIGQYAFLQAASEPKTRAQRIQLLLQVPEHFLSGMCQVIPKEDGKDQESYSLHLGRLMALAVQLGASVDTVLAESLGLSLEEWRQTTSILRRVS